MDFLEHYPLLSSNSLSFHAKHNDSIRTLRNDTKALCYGHKEQKQVLFTSRPLRVNEYLSVDLRYVKLEQVVGFGFTSQQPGTVNANSDLDLMAYCEVPSRSIHDGKVKVASYFTPYGHVVSEIDDKLVQLFDEPLDVTCPLYGVIMITNSQIPARVLKYQMEAIEFKTVPMRALVNSGTHLYGLGKVRSGDHVVLKINARVCFPMTVALVTTDPRRLVSGSPVLYWTIVSYDNMLSVGDEIAYTVGADGTVEYWLNGTNFTKGVRVDVGRDLWPYFHFNELDPKVELFTGYYQKNGLDERKKPVVIEMVASPSQATGNDCKLCYDSPTEVVLYACGHMCMCYVCAMKQWRLGGDGHCPICREKIQDVVKVFR